MQKSSQLKLVGGLVLAFALVAVVAFLVFRSSSSSNPQSGSKLQVVAAESFWGDIAARLGGDRVQVTTVIAGSAADPHDYEPTAADSRSFAKADYVIVNGADYDPWASRLQAASGNAASVLTVGELVGAKEGTNPHLWYSPEAVRAVIKRITADYERLSPSDKTYFTERQASYEAGELKQYNDLISEIKKRYAGTPVGSSESVFAPLAASLSLKLITPSSFLEATSEGLGPTAADKTLTDRQIMEKQISVYVFNRQNATPDVQRQVEQAKSVGIPVVTLSETAPAGQSFAQWQTAQLHELKQALAQGTGR